MLEIAVIALLFIAWKLHRLTRTTPSSRGGERRTAADAVDGDTIDEVRALLLRVTADVTEKTAKIVGSYFPDNRPPDLDASFRALMLLDER